MAIDVEKGQKIETWNDMTQKRFLPSTDLETHVSTQSYQNPLPWLSSNEICKLSSGFLGVAFLGASVAGYGFFSSNSTENNMNEWLIN